MNQLKVLNEHESKRVLAGVGIATPARWVLDRDEDCSTTLLGELAGRGPFAVKVLSETLVHKSESGGVLLNVLPESVPDAVDTVRRSVRAHGVDPEGVLIEEMISGDLEVIVGGYVDASFGPTVMVGLGGVFTEIFRDVTFGICPITRAEAREMVESLQAYPLLTGARGRPSLDVDGTIDVLMALGGADGLMLSDAGIVEVDINPIIVSTDRTVAADCMIRRAPESSEGDRRRRQALTVSEFERFLNPAAIAVVGASTSGSAPGNVFLKNIREQGYQGPIYPVHPVADEIDGLPTVRSLAELPCPVDYAFIAVNAERVPGVIESGAGKVAVAQVMSSGFRESESGAELERTLLKSAEHAGTRVIGPNCLGVYSPRGGITFVTRAPKEAGSVGLVSQSGGIGADIVHRGAAMGMRFSAAITIGNGADLGAADFLESFLADATTSVVGMYLEDAAQGRQLLEVLRAAPYAKPLVILRGGLTEAGKATAAGHTGSMAGEAQVWDAFARQSGAVMVDSLAEFVDVLRLFEICDGREGNVPSMAAVLVGNGGGVSVLGADSVEGVGLQVYEFSAEARAAMDKINVPPGMSVRNPVDAPAGAFELHDGAMLRSVLDAIELDAGEAILIPHMNLPVIRDNLRDPDAAVGRFINTCGRIGKESRSLLPPLLVLRSDGSAESELFRRQVATESAGLGMPTYAEIVDAARAAHAVLTWAHARRDWTAENHG